MVRQRIKVHNFLDDANTCMDLTLLIMKCICMLIFAQPILEILAFALLKNMKNTVLYDPVEIVFDALLFHKLSIVYV